MTEKDTQDLPRDESQSPIGLIPLNDMTDQENQVGGSNEERRQEEEEGRESQSPSGEEEPDVKKSKRGEETWEELVEKGNPIEIDIDFVLKPRKKLKRRLSNGEITTVDIKYHNALGLGEGFHVGDSGWIRKRSKPRNFGGLSVSSYQYEEFLNDEIDQFVNGPDKLDKTGLNESYITPKGSRGTLYQLGTRQSDSELGTRWTSNEKNIFFHFLGRYGSKQLDRIKTYLPKKSLLEVQNYHDILEFNVEYCKNHETRFMDLIRYDEIPSAYEIDDITLEMEEQLAKDLDNRITRKNAALYEDSNNGNNAGPEEFEDDENQVLNVRVLDSLCEFYQMDHLRLDRIETTSNKKKDPSLGFTARAFRETVYNYTKSIIKDIIRDTLYHQAEILKISKADEADTTEDNDLIGVKMTLPAVLKKINKLYPNRPSEKIQYINKLPHRLDFKLDDNWGLPDPVTMRKSRFKKEDAQLLKEFMAKTTYDDSHDQGFIVDDPEQNALLDDRIALKVFYQETAIVDQLDMEQSAEYFTGLKYWGEESVAKEIPALFERREIEDIKLDEKLREIQYINLPFHRLVKKINDIVGDPRFVTYEKAGYDEPPISEIYSQLDTDPSLHTNPPQASTEDVITEDMVLLHSQLF